MTTLKKQNLKSAVSLNKAAMKTVIGGYLRYNRCDYPPCNSNSDCSGGQVCTEWSDCPYKPGYGRKRCF